MRETVVAALQSPADSRTPRKQPMLLAISALLFVLWIVFLAFTALGG